MKTKTFFMLCLLSGIWFTELSAQLPDPYAHNKHGTGATITMGGPDLVWDIGVPVYCDGNWVDILNITCIAHYLDHWKDGQWISLDISIHGEAVSSSTGEVFKYNEKFTNSGFTRDPFILSWRCNVIGDRGSHYIMSFT
jgi:hypothetical protein